MDEETDVSERDMELFLRRKLGVEVRVREYERSENLWVVRVKNSGMKKEIMRNKNKLKNEFIYR